MGSSDQSLEAGTAGDLHAARCNDDEEIVYFDLSVTLHAQGSRYWQRNGWDAATEYEWSGLGLQLVSGTRKQSTRAVNRR